MLVYPVQQIFFDRLRSAFPQNAKPPFGYTDFIGETAVSGDPTVIYNSDGSSTAVSGNDGLYQGSGQGNLEYDPARRCVYPRSCGLTYHDNIVDQTSGGYSADTGVPRQILWTKDPRTDAGCRFGSVVASQGYYSMYALPALGITALNVLARGRMQPEDGGVCQGFTSILNIGIPNGAGAANYAAGTFHGTTFAAIRFRVSGSAKPPRWYSLAYNMGGQMSFSYNDYDVAGVPNEAMWQVIHTPGIGAELGDLVKRPSGSAQPAAHICEVRLLAGILTLKIGSQDTPFVWPHPDVDGGGHPDWYIDNFMLAAQQISGVEWSFHPTKFSPGASYISGITNIGFVPDPTSVSSLAFTSHYAPFDPRAAVQISGNSHGLTAEVGFAPDGCHALAQYYLPPDQMGMTTTTNVQYRLVFTNPVSGALPGTLIPYSSFTSCVRAVSFDVPAVPFPVAAAPYLLGSGAASSSLLVDTALFPGGLPHCEELDIVTQFDMSRLVNESSATFTCSNYKAIWTGVDSSGDPSGWLDGKGHFAIRMDVGIRGWLDGGGGQLMNTEFVGVANTRFTNTWGGGGKDKVIVECRDLWMLLDVMAFHLPWMDGWNVYYMMAYLARLAGFTDDQLAFKDLVPPRAYDDLPDSSYSPKSPRYFMPLAPTGTPITRFEGGIRIKEVMLKIANALGFVMYFDLTGLLHFEKFFVPAPSGYVKQFTHASGDASSGAYEPNGIWGGSYTRDLSDVRNSVTVFGKNLAPTPSAWAVTGDTRADLDSVYNDAVANYKGFFDPLIWEDQIFSTNEFASKAAVAQLNFLRIPDQTVSFTTWYQPEGVQTGQLIKLNYPRSGASNRGYYFFVVGTHVHITKTERPLLGITARLIPLPN